MHSDAAKGGVIRPWCKVAIATGLAPDHTIGVAMWVTLAVLLASPVMVTAFRDSLDNSVLKTPVRCTDKPLETRGELANVILTGTIRSLFEDADHPGLWKAKVEVKRVMKGNSIVDTLPGAWTNSVWRHKLVTVDGIGDPAICDSAVRKYDTRIFLLNEASNGELRINSSLLRMSLNNIDHADAVIKGKRTYMYESYNKPIVLYRILAVVTRLHVTAIQGVSNVISDLSNIVVNTMPEAITKTP